MVAPGAAPLVPAQPGECGPSSASLLGTPAPQRGALNAAAGPCPRLGTATTGRGVAGSLGLAFNPAAGMKAKGILMPRHSSAADLFSIKSHHFVYFCLRRFLLS